MTQRAGFVAGACDHCGFPRELPSFKIDENHADSVVVTLKLVVDTDKDVSEFSPASDQSSTSTTTQFQNLLTTLATIAATSSGVNVTPFI